MDLNLSKEDQSSIYELCSNFKIEASDPIIGVLVEIKHIKKDLLNHVLKDRECLQRLVASMALSSDTIENTLSSQKLIAEVFQKQLKHLESSKKRGYLLTAGFATMISGLAFWCGSVASVDRSLQDILNETGSTIVSRKDAQGTALVVKSLGIEKVVRNDEGVSIRFTKK